MNDIEKINSLISVRDYVNNHIDDKECREYAIAYVECAINSVLAGDDESLLKNLVEFTEFLTVLLIVQEIDRETYDTICFGCGIEE